jgi:hypothetical protein
MHRPFSAILIAILFALQHVFALDLPLEPSEAAVIEQIVATEQIDVQIAEMPSWAKNGAIRSLGHFGIETDALKSCSIVSKAKANVVLGMVYDSKGHVLALSGNGPWLRNSSLRALKKLPELRFIRIDHNGFVGKDPRVSEFDGSGFDALSESKLLEIRIGLSFSDRGMEQCAKILTLRSFSVAHSRVTDDGIRHFVGHPNLTHFSIAEMASNRVTQKALGTIAKIPRLTHLGFKECYVTYADGFALLKPLQGQLVELDLTMGIASKPDLDRLQSDHPPAKILTTPLAEIVKRHKFIAANLAKQVPQELAVALRESLGP